MDKFVLAEKMTKNFKMKMSSFKNMVKLKVVLLCLFLGFLVIFTVNSKAQNAKEMETLFLDLYHNRLIAETYIYKLNKHFSQKKIDLIELNLKKEVLNSSSTEDSITNLIANYSKTKLTREEEGFFESLKQHISQTKELELSSTNQSVKVFNLTTSYDNVLFDLNALSAIQLKEANTLFKKVDKNSSMELLSSELFWALGIVMLFAIISGLKRDVPFSLSSKNASHLLN